MATADTTVYVTVDEDGKLLATGNHMAGGEHVPFSITLSTAEQFPAGTYVLLAARNGTALARSNTLTLSEDGLTLSGVLSFNTEEVWAAFAAAAQAGREPSSISIRLTLWDSAASLQWGVMTTNLHNNDMRPSTPDAIFEDERSNAYVHQQLEADTDWVVLHGLGKHPQVTVTDMDGVAVIPGGVVYDSDQQLTVSFSSAQTGIVYCD